MSYNSDLDEWNTVPVRHEDEVDGPRHGVQDDGGDQLPEVELELVSLDSGIAAGGGGGEGGETADLHTQVDVVGVVSAPGKNENENAIIKVIWLYLYRRKAQKKV